MSNIPLSHLIEAKTPQTEVQTSNANGNTVPVTVTNQVYMPAITPVIHQNQILPNSATFDITPIDFKKLH